MVTVEYVPAEGVPFYRGNAWHQLSAKGQGLYRLLTGEAPLDPEDLIEHA